jgi:hypothetical protein
MPASAEGPLESGRPASFEEPPLPVDPPDPPLAPPPPPDPPLALVEVTVDEAEPPCPDEPPDPDPAAVVVLDPVPAPVAVDEALVELVELVAPVDPAVPAPVVAWLEGGESELHAPIAPAPTNSAQAQKATSAACRRCMSPPFDRRAGRRQGRVTREAACATCLMAVQRGSWSEKSLRDRLPR